MARSDIGLAASFGVAHWCHIYEGQGVGAAIGRPFLFPQNVEARGCGLPRRGHAPPRNDRGDGPGKKQRSFRGRKPVGIRFPFPLLPHVEKVKSEEVIVKRWKALTVGEGGPLGPGEGPHRRYSSHWFFSDPHPPAAQAPSPTGKACGGTFPCLPFQGRWVRRPGRVLCRH